MSIDAYVQLALIEKAKRVFAADPGVFLSFPLLSPVTYKPEMLATISSPSSKADYAAAADFARTVNFLPRDMVADEFNDRYLWDVYGDVLAHAEVAHVGGAQDGQGGGATLLYDVAPDGTRTESAAYRAFRQYRDAWIVAREDYSAHKLTGELADNPDAKKHWVDVEEPALRAAVTKAEEDFKTLGRRDEVEAALQASRDTAAHDPYVRWLEWSNAFNPDLDVLTEDTGSRYAPTGLSPRDFTADAASMRFDLLTSEMAKLIADAPAQLKGVLNDAPTTDITQVSFEYRSVALVRPWFQSTVLTSGIWRSNDPALILSDGGDPPTGACPGYVAAVVFVRNLQVTSGTAAAAQQAPGTLRFTLPSNRLLLRSELKWRRRPRKRASRRRRRRPLPNAPLAACKAKPSLWRRRSLYGRPFSNSRRSAEVSQSPRIRPSCAACLPLRPDPSSC